MPNNLNTFPLKSIDRFIDMLNENNISQVSLTGTNTDPQLYKYEKELIEFLRRSIPNVKLSLHTNGFLALKKIDVFNLYDRAVISFPSFVPKTYRSITGVKGPIDLAKIISSSKIPIKISVLLTEHNINEIPSLIRQCKDLGISRIVLRRRFGDETNWNLLNNLSPARYFGRNPVFDIDGVEVTLWNFSESDLECLNLFSDGVISSEYLLTNRDARKSTEL